jgi:hypothetical protein
LFATDREICWNKERTWDCFVPHCCVHMACISMRVQPVARVCALYSRVACFGSSAAVGVCSVERVAGYYCSLG